MCAIFGPNISRSGAKIELASCLPNKDALTSSEKVPKDFNIVSSQALKNVMYCHLKSYSCTSSGTRILPESGNLWQYPSTTASTGITL